MYHDKDLDDVLRDGTLFYSGPSRSQATKVSKTYSDAFWLAVQSVPSVIPIDQSRYEHMRDNLSGNLMRMMTTRISVEVRDRGSAIDDLRTGFASSGRDLVTHVTRWIDENPHKLLFVCGPDVCMSRAAYSFELYGWLDSIELELPSTPV